VETLEELTLALNQCVSFGWASAALCFSEYPFKKFDQKRLVFSTQQGTKSGEEAVVGLRFEQGQLAGIATERFEKVFNSSFARSK
jgi:hypothetical protein